jgi:hypothetical protein
MERFTLKMAGTDCYLVEESQIQHNDYGYSGDAVNRLAKYENFYTDLIVKQSEISQVLAKLRAEGKTNTVKFKQLLATKLANQNILILLKAYGLP